MSERITSSNSEIRLLDFPTKRDPFKVRRRVGCAEKLLQHIGMKPSILLEDGLELYFSKLTQNLRSIAQG